MTEALNEFTDARSESGSAGSGDNSIAISGSSGNGRAVGHGASTHHGVSGETAAILSMIERAARDPNVDIDKMERLFGMQSMAAERHARTAFLAAFSQLQAELPAATRGGVGHNAKKYARFEDVIAAVRPHLSAHGFSLSFRTINEPGTMRVIGVLGHRDGHTEQTDIVLPADASGSKNAVQAWGSSISYGKRYVALTLLGIATEDDDDGRKAVAGPTISQEQEDKLREAIEAGGRNLPKFCEFYRVEKLSDLPAAKFDGAMTLIKGKRHG